MWDRQIKNVEGKNQTLSLVCAYLLIQWRVIRNQLDKICLSITKLENILHRKGVCHNVYITASVNVAFLCTYTEFYQCNIHFYKSTCVMEWAAKGYASIGVSLCSFSSWTKQLDLSCLQYYFASRGKIVTIRHVHARTCNAIKLFKWHLMDIIIMWVKCKRKLVIFWFIPGCIYLTVQG